MASADSGDSGDALDVFAAWLSRRGNGEQVEFEELLRRHPHLADELVKLEATWRGLSAANDPSKSAHSLREQIKSRFGKESVPDVALRAQEEEGAREDFTTELIAQLSAHSTGFGRYRIRGEVARGGMGAILKIWDEDLRRHLAMKVILGQADASASGATPPIKASHVARFLEEAQVTGQLDHPGVVPVHELGLDPEGRLYFTMKLVKGRSLKEIFDLVADGEEGWTQTKALGVMLKICEAMAYTHDKGVIHRDLKPANVMVGKFGEVHVMDWGLARILDRPDRKDIRIREEDPPSTELRSERGEHRGETPDSPLYTMDGDVVGTPAYMPPEQAAGRMNQVGPHSDVYALGAMLYHLLAGHPPYVPKGAKLNNYAIWGLVQQSAPTPILRLAPGTPAELVAICEKAMRRDFERRYRDMSEMAEDLSAYLQQRVVHAYETGAWAEARKWVQRNRSLAASISVALLAILGGATIYVSAFHAAAGRRERASQRVAEATNEASSLLGQARAAGLQDLALWDRAVLAAEQSARFANDPDVLEELRTRVTAQLSTARDERDAARESAARAARDDWMLKRLIDVRIMTEENTADADWSKREVRRLDTAYSECFATYLGGRELQTLDFETASAALASGGIPVDLAAGLDHWAMARQEQGKEPDPPNATFTQDLWRLAARIDHGDEWRNDMRALLVAPEGDRNVLAALARRAALATLPAASVQLLAEMLWSADSKDAAIDVLRRGQTIHPADFTMSVELALMCETCGPQYLETAIAGYRIAVALQPERREPRHRLGRALYLKGALQESLEVFEQLDALHPGDADALVHIGLCQSDQGLVDAAIANYRKAIALDSKLAMAHTNLGNALNRQGHLDEAMTSYRNAINVDSREDVAHNNLGNCLRHKGLLEEAIASFTAAIAINSGVAEYYTNLGCCLADLGRQDEAIANYRKAIALHPQDELALANLGSSLLMQGHPDQAIKILIEALKFNSKSSKTRSILGGAYNEQGRLDDALDCLREAIHLDSTLAPAHFNLGETLRLRGLLSESLVEFRRALELFSQHDDMNSIRWAKQSQSRIEMVERHIRQEPELLAIIRGEREAASVQEWCDAASLANKNKDYLAALRLIERAFVADPKLQDARTLRYNAACTAALAGCGQGVGAEQLSDAERASVRAKALAWMRAELIAWRDVVDRGQPDLQKRVEIMKWSQSDPDLGGVRDEASLKLLPDEEAESWRLLWRDIAELVTKREEKK